MFSFQNYQDALEYVEIFVNFIVRKYAIRQKLKKYFVCQLRQSKSVSSQYLTTSW